MTIKTIGSSDSLFTSVGLPSPVPIQKKSASPGGPLRALVLTSNPLKQEEFESFLGKTYGIELTFRAPPEELTQEVASKTFSKEDSYFTQIRKILTEERLSPHYILREETRLVDALTKKVLSGLDIVEHPENAPPFLYNISDLEVWTPKWETDSTLKEIQHTKYSHSVKGYIDPSLKKLQSPQVLGWDHLFVNPSTGKTNLDNKNSSFDKNSARQLVLGDFATEHLLYRNPKSLQHHKDLQPHQAIEFNEEMSVSGFMQKNKYISNPSINKWGLQTIMKRILDEGVFFKAATSRPVKNFFSPPFGGIPLTAKKSDVEETIFMFHDLGHHLIPDLIFDGEDSPEMQNVYTAWRMMSEAMTLVLADMLYADTLVESFSEVERNVDPRIYGLFKALNLEEVNEENRQEIITSLLWANTRYAVLGDDSEWRKLLKEGEESKLEVYKNHFEKFFVGDHVWTHANYRNMASLKDNYKQWTDLVGANLLKTSNLLLLSEMANKLKAEGADLTSFEDTVLYVFKEIISQRIFKQELQETSSEVNEEERLSRAFCRYMIGQLSFYSRYQDLEGMSLRGMKLRENLGSHKFFSSEIRDELYKQYLDDVRYVWGLGCMTISTATNISQIHPIFPPIYINYSKQKHKTVREALTSLYGSEVLSKAEEKIS